MTLTLHHWQLDQFVPYPHNPRRNDVVVDKMCAVIEEFGFRIPIVAKSDGTVIDGHLRLKAAQRLGLAVVPVVLADELTESQIKAFRLVANRSASWADWDEELLNQELQELKDIDFDLTLTGFDLDEIESFLEDSGDTEFTEELDIPEVQETVVTQPGDLWILGDHRILCGDATCVPDYQKLMGNGQADMVFTDPPYNVNYIDIKQNKLMNDNLGEGFEHFLRQACENILQFTQGAIYICMSCAELGTLHQVFQGCGGKWSTFIMLAESHGLRGCTWRDSKAFWVIGY